MLNKFSVLMAFCLACLAFNSAKTVAATNDTHEKKLERVYLLRHFEKQVSQQKTADPSLSKEGLQYASELARILSRLNISYIYSSPYQRTQASAKPSADYFGLDVLMYNPSDLSGLSDKILDLSGNVLVVGHSNTTPALFALLGCPKITIGEDDYNEVYVADFSDKQGPKCSQFALRLPE